MAFWKKGEELKDELFGKFQKVLGIKDDKNENEENKEETPDGDDRGFTTAVPTSTVAEEHYKIKPLDLILFSGKDAVSDFIRWVEYKYVKVDGDDKPSAYWTHAGLVVDKNILPLPELEDGRLYIYESIFSGSIAGYTYSKVFPIDIPGVVEKGNHAGPQVRDLLDVVNEGSSDVGVCPLDPEERNRLLENKESLSSLLLEFHEKYKSYSYPFNILPQLASASDGLANFLTGVAKNVFKDDNPDADDRKAVFCSEMAALLYQKLGIKGFVDKDAKLFTPVEVELADAFTHECFWIKHDGVNYIQEDKCTLKVVKAEHS